MSEIERAINLRDWEVLAIQAGRLKMLVRPVKPQPYRDTEMRHTMFVGGTVWVRNSKLKADWAHAVKNPESMIQFCPYGQPGDRLRGREVWRAKSWSEEGWGEIEYRVDGNVAIVEGPWSFTQMYPFDMLPDAWRSAVLMPRWAVRNWLEITEVRCGRVREMSEEEAWMTGVEQTPGTYTADFAFHGFRDSHSKHYDADHGAGAWERDWVWMIGVKRIEGGV